MENQANLGGVFRLPRTSLTLNRIGYGAMQLPGPQVWGPPKDRYAAIALLKEAIALERLTKPVYTVESINSK
jgi:pyridoxine 4-dehydrogenase